MEINALTKRNLDFKWEVESHEVRLLAYCNNKILSILSENISDSEYYTDSWC